MSPVFRTGRENSPLSREVARSLRLGSGGGFAETIPAVTRFGRKRTMKIQKQNRNQKRGAALVEYGLIIAGVALVAVAAISIFGHKTGGIIASTARVLPGAQAEDNQLVSVGKIVDTNTVNGAITVDTSALDGDQATINSNLGLGADELATDPNN